jgi:hypothetical protein
MSRVYCIDHLAFKHHPLIISFSLMDEAWTLIGLPKK